MSENSQKSRARLDELNEALNSGAFIQIRRMLNSLPPAEVAHLIESTPPKMRTALWQLIDLESEMEFITPSEIAGEDDVFVSRVREDPTLENGINFWCVADNLRKGAALNTVQIAEKLIKNHMKAAA